MKITIKTTIVALGLVIPTQAAPIIYTFSGTSSGSVGTTPFTDQAFVIRVSADTTSVVQLTSTIFTVADISSTLDISGFASAVFTGPEHVFVNQPSGLGFSRGDSSGSDLLGIFELSAFANYDLRRSFGPVFESSPQSVSQFTNEPTTLGNVTFTSARNVTFVATVVPEPSSLMLLNMCLPIVLCSRRRNWRIRQGMA